MYFIDQIKDKLGEICIPDGAETRIWVSEDVYELLLQEAGTISDKQIESLYSLFGWPVVVDSSCPELMVEVTVGGVRLNYTILNNTAR